MRARTVLAGAALTLGLTLAAVPQARAGQQLEGVPRYDHVGVLVLENESESSTWGAGSVAKFLNSLVSSGAFASNYYADGHVSLDNYITLTSGLPGNADTYSDCLSSNLFTCQASVTAQQVPPNSALNVADQVESSGQSWKEYADSAPSTCFHADLSPIVKPPDPYQGNSTAAPAGNYADRHNPFVYYTDITGNAARCAAHDVPFTQLSGDIAADTMPNYFFITPDTCHDGHDSPCASGSPMPAFCPGGAAAAATAGGLTAADCWLYANLPSLLQYLYGHNGVLFITTDEGSSSDTAGCCTGGQAGQQGVGGKVGLLAIGPGVAAGTTSAHPYDHVSLLRTMEDALGIGVYLNNASTATAMSDLFAQPAANSPEVPLAALLPLAGAAALIAWRRRTSRA